MYIYVKKIYIKLYIYRTLTIHSRIINKTIVIYKMQELNWKE